MRRGRQGTVGNYRASQYGKETTGHSPRRARWSLAFSGKKLFGILTARLQKEVNRILKRPLGAKFEFRRKAVPSTLEETPRSLDLG